jgi:hypothetical protein
MKTHDTVPPAPAASPKDPFLTGLVFGFDVGTASIGYAVRKGAEFLDMGVLICDSKSADLENRRNLRRQRRTLDHRQSRRDWFAENLAKVFGLVLHKGTRLPESAWAKNSKGGWVPISPKLACPVSLRVAALAGEPLTVEQLFTALVHLTKHRGPAEKVPWSKTLSEKKREEDEKEKESASDTIPADQVRAEFENARKIFVSQNPDAPAFHPAHYLLQLDDAGKRQRKRAWPHDLAEAEAAAILETQSCHHRRLKDEIEFRDVSGKQRKTTVAEWLLHGNSSVKTMREGAIANRFHVFDRNHLGRERGPFTYQAARIHNRKPGLDLVEPRDEFGRPRYVMSRERPEYRRWQIEIALLNFKVHDLTSLKKKKPLTVPSAKALDELREIIARTGKLSLEDLQNWIKPYQEKRIYGLVEKQTDLVGEGEGRGRFNIFGLQKATEIIRPLQAEHDAMSKLTPKGQRAKQKLKTPEDKADAYVRQYVNYTPKLRYNWKNPVTRAVEPEPLPRALRRYIQEIRDPVVRHRVELFDRMLDDLLEKHRSEGTPSHIIVECVRKLEQDSEDAQAAWEKQKGNREKNQVARTTLKDMGIKEPTDKDIRKFRLLDECKWRCPYNPQDRFMQSEFDDLVIHRIIPPVGDPRRPAYLKAARAALHSTHVEHMVPQAATVCDEWFNVTVTRSATNQAKGDRIPYEFILRDADEDRRRQLLDNAANCFGADSLKFKIFSSPDARSLIQERDKLQRTAYIARCLRYVCLLKFGWLSPEDRDPGHEKANDASRGYLVTNGGTTHRLRGAWNLDELLRETISAECWASMTDSEKERALSQGARIPSEEWKKLDKAKQDEALLARRTKNRQDVRHHALDAMVVACTLPWAANLTAWGGGWCNLDPEDGSVSSVQCPVFGEKDFGKGIYAAAEVKLAELKSAQPDANRNTIIHYRSHERHKQVFDSQLYGRRTSYDGKPLDRTAFVVSKKLCDLTPGALNESSLGDVIFSPKLRGHITNAWKAYTADTANWRRVLNRSRSELEKEKAEALQNKAKPQTLEAIGRRLWRVGKWIEAAPNAELWEELQKFLHKEKGVMQPKAVFPDDFIATLRHWRYGTEIRSVRVIGQTKDEDAYAELRAGSKTFWKYKGRYVELRVYEQPAKTPKASGKFICWRIRPFYPRKRDENGKLESWKEARSAAMPAACRNRKLVATFHNGQVIRFTRSLKNMEISHNWLICETNPGGLETNSQIVVIPAHLAAIVRDPDNPKKLVNLKDTESEKLGLNDFMWALGYEPPGKGYELPHPPSVKPQSAGPAET